MGCGATEAFGLISLYRFLYVLEILVWVCNNGNCLLGWALLMCH